VTINRAVDFCRRRLTLVPEFEGPATSQLRSITGWKAMPHASITGWNSTPHAIERGDEEAFRGDVAGAFDGLSDGQRIVLTAKVFDGLTFAEIAAEHDLAVSTVKTHYLRAVRAVRDRLAPRWGNAASPPRERAGRD
jgi:DNA-directed RNA polymerase specialized sigma24 family protein